MAEKTKVKVRIAGKDYTLVGMESDEYLQKIAFYVDKKMNEVIKANDKLSMSMITVLTALNLADDYYKALERGEKLAKEIQQYKAEMENLSREVKRIAGESAALKSQVTTLQLELARREAELNEVRSALNRTVRKP